MRIFGLCVSIALINFGLFAGPALAQQPPSFGDGNPVTVGLDATTKYYDFKSALNGRTYRIFVSIPHGTPPQEGFPVIYVLDGNYYFGMVSDSLSVRSHFNASFSPAIVVGIGYPTSNIKGVAFARWKDLTTPIGAERLKTLQQLPPGGYPQLAFDVFGGVDDFLRVIEEEIKPEVARLAAINTNEQALYGHSLGGLQRWPKRECVCPISINKFTGEPGT